ncbi:MAG: hypothetical protein AABX85_03180 [Nanoarchaeota archaeon]
MNSFLSSVEKDLERQMYVSTFRTIFLFEKKVVDSKRYIENPEELASEGFFNGTLYSQSQGNVYDGIKFSDFLSSTQTDAKQMNIEINITGAKLNMTQEDPWNIAIILTANLTMSDKSNLAYWNKTLIVKAYIPIERFEDPVYLLNTAGKIPNKYSKSPYTLSNTDLKNLSLHLENSYYIASTEAPSFIDRLKGNLAAESPYGVESLVNINTFNSQGLTVYVGRPMVDHIYFDLTNPATFCTVSGTNAPANLLLDDAHKIIYNVATCS